MKLTIDVSQYSHVSKLTNCHLELQIKYEIIKKSAKQQIMVPLIHEYMTHIFNFLSEDSLYTAETFRISQAIKDASVV